MDTTDQDLPKQKPKTLPPKAADLLGKALDPLSTKPESDSTPDKLPDRLLEKLWFKMIEMYGHRWVTNYGLEPQPDSVWGKVLGGLSGAQLAIGMGVLVEKGAEFDWPPPANVFRQLCLQVSGMPSTDEAWIQALKGVYTHPAVKIAAEATGTFDLRESKPTNKALYQQFERNYAIVMRRAQTGQPLEGRINAGISHDGKTPRQMQLAQSHQEARDLLIAQNIPTDPKAARALLLARMGIRRSPDA